MQLISHFYFLGREISKELIQKEKSFPLPLDMKIEFRESVIQPLQDETFEIRSNDDQQVTSDDDLDVSSEVEPNELEYNFSPESNLKCNDEFSTNIISSESLQEESDSESCINTIDSENERYYEDSDSCDEDDFGADEKKSVSSNSIDEVLSEADSYESEVAYSKLQNLLRMKMFDKTNFTVEQIIDMVEAIY